jgi:uncharacterized protein (DUF433 family)
MSFVETRYEHVVMDEHGVPYIAGTTMKVVELVVAHAEHGWSPEELRFQFPYLSLGQIYSSLAYYWDHQGELDQDIARRRAMAEQLQQQLGSPMLQARLRERAGH